MIKNDKESKYWGKLEDDVIASIGKGLKLDTMVGGFIKNGVGQDDTIALFIVFGIEPTALAAAIAEQQKKGNKNDAVKRGDETTETVYQRIPNLEMATVPTYNTKKKLAAIELSAKLGTAACLKNWEVILPEKVDPNLEVVLAYLRSMLKLAVSAGWDEHFVKRATKVLFSETLRALPDWRPTESFENWASEELGRCKLKCEEEYNAFRSSRGEEGLKQAKILRRQIAALLWCLILYAEKRGSWRAARTELDRLPVPIREPERLTMPNTPGVVVTVRLASDGATC